MFTLHNNTKKFITSILLALSMMAIFFACNESPTEVDPQKNMTGVTGTVYDTDGNALDSVQIYCLYSYGYIPNSQLLKSKTCKLSGLDTFGFALYQNFPNPFSQNTFIRFSIPEAGKVHLVIRDKVTGSTVYQYDDSIPAGLYQLHINKFDDSLKLLNGMYTYRFDAQTMSGRMFRSEKQMLLISDRGTPISITQHGGKYYFNYASACIGDTLVVTYDDMIDNERVLENTINFYVKRNGFHSLTVSTELFPQLLLKRDIVLRKVSAE